ncbi:hypothetical protein BJF79_46975 [Actinomadura sp. CNU-125]|uniref:hypothetical protein n=1 Tax=Actinomadura sp. CNU-125 TaxID=1904961 RepID=UPI0009612945|nr:hypothetical protein [Actinomadura sp. CNU-125]OLT21077.1 hypothetical protein BJF79_46975 [Actinomadura sp. CNU-125]
MPAWFFVTGSLLAVLCFPVGMLVAKADANGADCSPDNLCFSMDAVYWWCNGFYVSFPPEHGLLT